MDDLAISLKELEEGNLIPIEIPDEELELLDEELEFTDEATVFAPPPPPITTTEWSVNSTPRYRKITSKVRNKKLKGRIYDAESYLFTSPMTPKSDIVKSLKKIRKGLWEHKIGGYRLAYIPNKEDKVVTLVYFGTRENFYKELDSLSG